MKKLESAIVALSRFCLGVSFTVLIVAVLVQVLGRAFSASPVWTEELTRFALLYMCAFGVGLAWRSGDLVNVDIVCESLPGQWPRRLRLLAALISGALCVFLLIPAWKFVSIGAFQTSPAMGLQMTYVHLSVFIFLFSLTLFALLRVLSMLSGGDDGLAINRKPDN